MKRIAGYGILGAIFMFFFVAMAIDKGFIPALVITLIVFALVGLILLATYWIVGD